MIKIMPAVREEAVMEGEVPEELQEAFTDDDDIPPDDDRGEPGRDQPDPGEGDERGEHQELVCSRIEQASQSRAPVESSRKVAVQGIGEARDQDQAQGQRISLLQQAPHDRRNQDDARDADHVRDVLELHREPPGLLRAELGVPYADSLVAGGQKPDYPV